MGVVLLDQSPGKVGRECSRDCVSSHFGGKQTKIDAIQCFDVAY